MEFNLRGGLSRGSEAIIAAEALIQSRCELVDPVWQTVNFSYKYNSVHFPPYAFVKRYLRMILHNAFRRSFQVASGRSVRSSSAIPPVHRRRSGQVQMNASAPSIAPAPAVKPETQVPGMTSFLDSLKFNQDNLVAVIVQVSSK